jgi:SAM-dependent methyltransferase
VAHRVSDCDDFALIYNRHWGPRYAANALETLDSLVLSRIPTGGRVLDLCCGAGQISHLLADRGYDVVGLDESASLIEFARKNAPNSHFEVADAKSFSLSNRFQAAIALNDSGKFGQRARRKAFRRLPRNPAETRDSRIPMKMGSFDDLFRGKSGSAELARSHDGFNR